MSAFDLPWQPRITPHHQDYQRESILLSTAEKKVLKTFREYQITPGQMLCFSGPNLDQHLAALELMSDKELLVKEKFRGGYSLTQSGFQAVQHDA